MSTIEEELPRSYHGPEDLNQAGRLLRRTISELNGAVRDIKPAKDDLRAIDSRLFVSAQVAGMTGKAGNEAEDRDLQRRREAAVGALNRRIAETEKLLKRLDTLRGKLTNVVKRQRGNLKRLREGRSRLRKGAIADFERAEIALVREVGELERLLREANEASERAQSELRSSKLAREPPSRSFVPARERRAGDILKPNPVDHNTLGPGLPSGFGSTAPRTSPRIGPERPPALGTGRGR